MEKNTYDEKNGLWYERQGDYYIPCLTVPESPPIGLWGQQHLRYIREHKKSFYTALLMSNKLNDYLAEVDKSAAEMYDRLVAQLAAREGITEQLKAQDQMAWVRAMNNIRNAADEIILYELVCT